MIRSGFFGVVSVLLCCAAMALGAVADSQYFEDTTHVTSILSPEWREAEPPPAASKEPPAANAYAAMATATQQPVGALTGRIVFMNAGHGWVYRTNGYWSLMRPTLQEMNEDYGNIDQLNFFAMYCFNAGAVVVPFRPLGQQTNEVVLDNDDAAVTFSTGWANSSSSLFYGSSGDVPYRYASLAATETATATYTPNIPVAGFYPIYTWVRHGTDRGHQLYRIKHTGGESHVRIPHFMVGNGWVYLGEYHLNAGSNSASGSVVISNLRSTTNGSVVIADAIRFGNGMGSVSRGTVGISRYPREEESNRYWIQTSLGQGQSTSLYESSGHDEQDGWSSPGKMSAEMNLGPSGTLDYKRIHIGFHSNASSGSGRGAEGLITGSPTPNQARLAYLVGKEVNEDLRALGAPPLEFSWSTRTSYTYTGSYGEISTGYFNNEMDATILEVAYHDNTSDAKLMRDSKARAAIAKATMHTVMKYFDEFGDGNATTFLPEPPTNLRAIAGTNGQTTLSWTAPVNIGGSSSPTNYIIYRSTNGYGFGNPINAGNVLTCTISNLAPDIDYYFRVSASNAGGESMPSAVAGCRASSIPNAPKVLVVNAFDRFDRTTNLRQNTTAQNWVPPNSSGTIERVWPRRVNSFDYVVPHGKSISAANMAFDSCGKLAVTSQQVRLTNYSIVIWAAGQEMSGLLDSTAQSLLTSHLQSGRGLFISGSEIAQGLGRSASPATSRQFFTNQLHATLATDSHTNSGSYTVTASGIFAGIASGTIDNGARGIYWVKGPEVLTPNGVGVSAALNYSSGIGPAAIQYDGSAGGGRVVYFGFPFETITAAARRDAYMSRILDFLSVPPPAGSPIITSAPTTQTVNRYADVTFTVGVTGEAPLFYQWRFNAGNIAGATDAMLTLQNVQTNQAGSYSVVVSNAVGSVMSGNATLTVVIPTVTETFFSDNFDTDTSSGWIVNRSSTDTRVTFNYNYGANGIPAAPNSSGGTQRGVKFEANMVNTNAAAISISPSGKTFSGDFDLKFDLWINANGPFPDGGAGSTEHATAGVGTTGTKAQWGGTGTTADGTWFAASGEGGAGDTSTYSDYMAYVGTAQQTTNSGVYAAGTAANARAESHSYYAATFPGGQLAPATQRSAYPNQSGSMAVGSIGFQWRNVLISKRGTKVEWFIDGLKMAGITNGNFAGNNIFIGYWDAFNSLSDNAAVSFGLVDNLRVQRTTEAVLPAIAAQPQNRSVVEGTNVSFSVSATGTTNLYYQWRFNGSPIPGATSSSYGITNVQVDDAGDYSVVVTNIAGKATSSNATLVVLVPPSILAEPENQSGRLGDSAIFNVLAGGSEPFHYQWRFNGAVITGETGTALVLTNLQETQFGSYSVVVTNAAGSITSAPALLTLELPPPAQFDSVQLGESGELQLLLRGARGTSFSLEVSTNLTNWVALTNFVMGPEEEFEFIDASRATNTHQFYRMVSPE